MCVPPYSPADSLLIPRPPHHVLVLFKHIVTNTYTNREVGFAIISLSIFTVTNKWLLQRNSSDTFEQQDPTCSPGVITMSRSTTFRAMTDDYHTTEEITEMWRRLNKERCVWTLQQHKEWQFFLYYQCLARDERYERKSLSECLRDTASTSISLSMVLCAILAFHDNIFDCAVWSKDYIYEFVCLDCSIRGIAVIMTGALFGSLWLVLSLSVLLWAIWTYKRWISLALAMFLMAECLTNGVQQLYKAWSG